MGLRILGWCALSFAIMFGRCEPRRSNQCRFLALPASDAPAEGGTGGAAEEGGFAGRAGGSAEEGSCGGAAPPRSP